MALDTCSHTTAAVVLELMTMGKESTAYLGDLLRATSPASAPQQELVAEILRCCGRVIGALSAATTGGHKRKAAEYQEPAGTSSPPPTAPPPKRRARGGEATREVVSGTVVDGFIWRKYGQKEINGHRHPRRYYRCAHKTDQGCGATRRVQQTQDQPAVYEIAYYGDHTCGAACQQGGAPPPGVVDFGSNSWAGSGYGSGVVDFGSNSWGGSGSGSGDANGGSPAASDQWLEASQGGWSSASSEVGFEPEAHTHEAPRAEETGATPCYYAFDPVTEFLDGCYGWDWEFLLGDHTDFGGLRQDHHVAAFQ